MAEELQLYCQVHKHSVYIWNKIGLYILLWWGISIFSSRSFLGFSPCSISLEADLKGLWKWVSFPLAFSGISQWKALVGNWRTWGKTIGVFIPLAPPTGSWVGGIQVPLPLATAPIGQPSLQTQAPPYAIHSILVLLQPWWWLGAQGCLLHPPRLASLNPVHHLRLH